MPARPARVLYVRVSQTAHDAVAELAAATGISMTAIVEMALVDALELSGNRRGFLPRALEATRSAR